MVNLSTVRSANVSRRSSRSGLVAVVVGGTNGIGRGFLDQLARQTDQPKIYIVGRGGAERLASIIAELQAINPSGTYIAVPCGDLSLLHEIDAASKRIAELEPSHVDLLFMSQGFLSFDGSLVETAGERLDRITAVRHHSRMLLAANLMPLLEASRRGGRVLAVLAGGKEGAVYPDDLALRDPAHRAFRNLAGASTTYVTLGLEQLARRHPRVSFVHAFPGLVQSNLLNDPEQFGPVFRFFMNWVILPILGPFVWTKPDVFGERLVYVASSPNFGAPGSDEDLAVGSNGEKGSGVYTINETQEPVHSDKVLKPLREQKMDDKIWDYTQGDFKRILGRKAE